MLPGFGKNREWFEQLTIVMQLGLTMAGCILFCFFIGRYLDRTLQLKGAFTVLFILLGVAGGAVVVWRQIKEIIEPPAKNRPDSMGANNDVTNDQP